MVVNPVTIGPEATLADALALMGRHRISGVPVVENANGKGAGKLVGILTNRDVRFRRRSAPEDFRADDQGQVITVREGVQSDEAKRLLHQHRIEKIIVVDDAYRCVGLITVKDIERPSNIPMPARMSAEGCASPPPPVWAKRLCPRHGADRSGMRRDHGGYCFHGHSRALLRQPSLVSRRRSNYTRSRRAYRHR